MLVIESALFDGDRMSEEGIHKPFLGCAANDGGVSRGEEVPTVIESGHFRAYFFAAGAVVIEDQVIAGFGWPGFRVRKKVIQPNELPDESADRVC